MNKKRPVNLDLMTVRFPITAITSILHRISGVILFFCIPILLYFLSCSLSDQISYDAISAVFESFPIKLLNFLILSALIYHFVAGIRHLIMDVGIGETKMGGKLGAKVMLFMSILLIVILGVWLWVL
ncbi:MAG: succinate dehydrogenase, cytochrome b556 subunit [Legionellales bacterium]|nr:succinate dehydrogenase, cytochrome b556 subunit [Legionellales bacterium]